MSVGVWSPVTIQSHVGTTRTPACCLVTSRISWPHSSNTTSPSWWYPPSTKPSRLFPRLQPLDCWCMLAINYHRMFCWCDVLKTKFYFGHLFSFCFKSEHIKRVRPNRGNFLLKLKALHFYQFCLTNLLNWLHLTYLGKLVYIQYRRKCIHSQLCWCVSQLWMRAYLYSTRSPR